MLGIADASCSYLRLRGSYNFTLPFPPDLLVTLCLNLVSPKVDPETEVMHGHTDREGRRRQAMEQGWVQPT